MSIVGRKGKLSLQNTHGSVQDITWERIEDVLTADVFGAYRYLPLKYGLIPFLSHARDERRLTLSEFLANHAISLESLNYARILFWPRLEDQSEPDLLILLGTGPDGLQVALMVEAKFYSSQHEIEKAGTRSSQIGHYLIQHHRGAHGPSLVSEGMPPLRPLLFLTRDARPPYQDLSRARREVRAALPDLTEEEVGLFWCSWAQAGVEARRLWRAHRAEIGERPWLRLLLDVWQEIEHRGLMPRAPFRRLPTWVKPLPIWRYAPRLGIGPPPGKLQPRIYQRPRVGLNPLDGKLPEVVYARPRAGVLPWPRTKSIPAPLYPRKEHL